MRQFGTSVKLFMPHCVPPRSFGGPQSTIHYCVRLLREMCGGPVLLTSTLIRLRNLLLEWKVPWDFVESSLYWGWNLEPNDVVIILYDDGEVLLLPFLLFKMMIFCKLFMRVVNYGKWLSGCSRHFPKKNILWTKKNLVKAEIQSRTTRLSTRE